MPEARFNPDRDDAERWTSQLVAMSEAEILGVVQATVDEPEAYNEWEVEVLWDVLRERSMAPTRVTDVRVAKDGPRSNRHVERHTVDELIARIRVCHSCGARFEADVRMEFCRICDPNFGHRVDRDQIQEALAIVDAECPAEATLMRPPGLEPRVDYRMPRSRTWWVAVIRRDRIVHMRWDEYTPLPMSDEDEIVEMDEDESQVAA